MTPEAAQDLQAYFGMEIFGDDEEDFESKNENTMKLTESKLRNIIREELSKLTELGMDESFIRDFANALAQKTGEEFRPHVGAENEDVVRFKSPLSGILDLYVRSGGSRGAPGPEISVQVYDRKGKVRTGFTAPADPNDAAEVAIQELEKINAL